MGDITKLSVLSGRPTIQTYAQGRAREETGEIADFIAPTVETAVHAGKYKEYGKANRFKLPETLRGLGGRATQLAFDRTDKEYNCAPHALDVPLDDIEIDEEQGENLLMEAADESASLGGMAHEKGVIDLAVSSATPVANAGVLSSPDFDPVAKWNELIIAVYLAVGGGSKMEIGIVIDPMTVVAFFANKMVKGYFPGIDTIAPTLDNMKKLFVGNTNTKISFLATDVEPAGKAARMAFALTSKVLIFARNGNPTRRDPSFMKTFRVRNRWMTPGTYRREDERGEVVKMDWSMDVKCTNPEAGKLVTIE
jgi:hypothetical protein